MQETFVLNLKRIALVGDPWERQAVREHYKDEIATLADQFEFIDLLGLPMTEIRKRVAVLPEDTVIIYTAINVDGAGVAYIPREALAAVAEVSNRPIVIDAETSVGYGGTGGLITRPHLIGQQTAQIVLRIFNGERPSEFPLPSANSSSRCSTGVNCKASESARAGCLRVARSVFANSVYGSGTAGRWLPSSSGCSCKPHWSVGCCSSTTAAGSWR